MMRSKFAILFLLIVADYATADGSNTTTTEGPESTTLRPTTTLKPDTTTPLPTTTPPPTPPTTPPPTTPPPATTAAPAPDVPKVLNFTVSDGNNTCITAEFALSFTHLWNGTDSVVVVDPTFNNKSSKCGNETETLSFSFPKGTRTYSVLMTFKKVEEERSLSMIEVTEGSNKVTINQTAFQLKGDMAYHCEHQTEVKGDGGVVAAFDHVKLSIFRTEASGKQVYQCVSDDTVNDMVPIAVGCALLALVVIVLIAYFIGRRRSRRLAYQSV